jgi:hypothetical protein
MMVVNGQARCLSNAGQYLAAASIYEGLGARPSSGGRLPRHLGGESSVGIVVRQPQKRLNVTSRGGGQGSLLSLLPPLDEGEDFRHWKDAASCYKLAADLRQFVKLAEYAFSLP